jgi:hypothetical protein
MLTIALDLPWFELLGRIWKIGRKIVRGLSREGIYEVLDYECQLELKGKDGRLANIKKREKIRYFQDYITSYQDQAWGDGGIFINYKCSPGLAVDEYRLGHNTYKLISLREFRNKGDMDEFNTEWSMQNGFLKSTGFWGTGINHRTKKVTVEVIFPKDRPPLQVSVTESNLQRTQLLGRDNQRSLPDGRQRIIWEKENPRLYENYVLKWEW